MVFTLVKLSDDFIIGKPNTKHKSLAKNNNTSTIPDYVKTARHNIGRGHFDILAKTTIYLRA